MKIVLLGYMGSGKSTIGKHLSDILDYNFRDLDHDIEKTEQATVSEIFKNKGAIYFRKREALILKKLLNEDNNMVLALGGGTPCYADNLDYIKSKEKTLSVYLKGSIPFLSERLFQEKESRPLISEIESKDELMEFIGKHLFERSSFYQQADLIIEIDHKNPEQIVEKILLQLF